LANVVRLANALSATSGHDLTAKPTEETAVLVKDGTVLLGLAPDTVSGVLAALPARLAGRMA
jgi:hypothetical protein